jgi:hypothetical protein
MWLRFCGDIVAEAGVREVDHTGASVKPTFGFRVHMDIAGHFGVTACVSHLRTKRMFRVSQKMHLVGCALGNGWYARLSSCTISCSVSTSLFCLLLVV